MPGSDRVRVPELRITDQQQPFSSDLNLGQGKRKVPKADPLRASPSSATGGIVKAEGLGDGLTQGKAAIANPCLRRQEFA